MEEAEALCDRIGVLADVCLQCIANPARGNFVLSYFDLYVDQPILQFSTAFCIFLMCIVVNDS